MEVLIVDCEDGWKAIYIDGTLINQGHELGDGDILFILELSEKYNFNSKDIRQVELNPVDENDLYESGRYPEKLSDLKGEY